ncbi:MULTISPECIES: inositol monophosphatase family protein [Thermomonospora]|uniref:Inositol-1-monophosphatase n=1 Tax=Thermomonospora curvata (strain ATCC 19995 / DSM 43183 / JCM 3096 / KCTC 9072 / NBRC 15933 / NCIMB 10081 / Henssen B9) TaxID=471852 RepID=D1AC01_THECD|nr:MULTISPECIES: inositol monophosphatase family protein [Thermomonospora]ACY97267.1 inositol monophosphatase [Thermomonospora curvata DSM 43183]PKK14638.1 MAG: inositol monophosphatase [Thermomonospora sp. CIF 1]
MSLHEELLELALEIAGETGRMLVGKRPVEGPAVVQTKSSPTDVVTQMDRAAEQLIVERIRAARPADAILGEESGASAGGSAVRWVVDPIDGTVNYLYDLPDWSVSIAAEIDGRTAVGVVEVPRRGETYLAVRGGGARLRDAAGERPLRCTADVPLNRALVATGFGYESRRRAHQARVLTGVLPHVRDIRRGGACSVDLCTLAAGRVDGYYERGVQLWDIAAGTLIVEEAGGRVGGLHGAAPGPEFVLAAGPGTFEALHDLLAPLDPARD